MNYYIANASGELANFMELINLAYDEAKKICIEKLGDLNTDIIFIVDPSSTIHESGVGGYTPSSKLIYVSLDPRANIKIEDVKGTILHEMHHAKRWLNPGYGTTLGEALITEGLACAFEEESIGIKPIYADVKIQADLEAKARYLFDSQDYNYLKWFISGDETIPRWFGYTFGYKIAKKIISESKMPASKLVDLDLRKYLN